MAMEGSFSSIPDAPIVPEALDELVRSHSGPDQHGQQDPGLVPLNLPIPPSFTEVYPKLRLHQYHTKQEAKGTNVLAFLHNAAKREVADLVAVVIPALEQHARIAPSSLPMDSADGFGESFHSWWKLSLRFYFFVAETNDDIIAQMMPPVIRRLKRGGDIKLQNSLQKQRKSISDRYEFSMEVVFRAADRALLDLEEDGDQSKVRRLVEKLEAMARFVLDTLQLVMDLAAELENLLPDLEISGLESCISDKLAKLGKDDKPILIYTCARWMNEEEYIKPWIIKYGGIWSRMMFKSWQESHKEQRVAILDKLESKYVRPQNHGTT